MSSLCLRLTWQKKIPNPKNLSENYSKSRRIIIFHLWVRDRKFHGDGAGPRIHWLCRIPLLFVSICCLVAFNCPFLSAHICPFSLFSNSTLYVFNRSLQLRADHHYPPTIYFTVLHTFFHCFSCSLPCIHQFFFSTNKRRKRKQAIPLLLHY